MDQQKRTVVARLQRIYGGVVDPEIIDSVALNCRFHFARSSAILEEISSNVGPPKPTGIIARTPSGTLSSCRPTTSATLSGITSPFRPRNGITNPAVGSLTTLGTTVAAYRQKNTVNPRFLQATDQIRRGYKVLVILRGLPGSGKSYLARKIVEVSIGTNQYHNFIFSADDYFMRRGTYQYDATKIHEAHTFNQQRAFAAMDRGVSPVIIDNTNTQMWEMKPYAMVASQNGYIIEILEPNTPWAFNDKELARRNIHGVPRVKLKEMLMRYEKDIIPSKLLHAFNIRYIGVLPQMRSHPPLMVTENANIFEEKVVEAKKEEHKSTIDELLSHLESDDNAAVLKPKKVATIPAADLSVWGVSETALHSWDLCTPLTQTEKFEQKQTMDEVATEEEVVVETAEAATNTSAADFALIANPGYIEKVLLTTCRDINEHGACVASPAPRKKILVDKSCMVGEDLMEQRLEKTDALEKLSAVFTYIPKIYLREIYDRCNGDLNWSIDLLCDDNLHNLVAPQEGLPDDEEEELEEEKEKQMEAAVEVIDLPALPVTEETTTTQAEREELKRLLEEKVVIRDDFYSEHTLKLKSKATFDPSSQPSTSKIQKINTDAGNVIAADSDVDMDDFDLESTSGSNSGSDSQEMMELNLGKAFVAELENKLQEPNLEYPKGFLPVVQVPVALARQLYALYIESVYQQMDAQNEVLDMLVKEDEEFAKKLQAQEAQSQPQQPSTEPTTIPEIMQEQHELNLCRKEVEQWKNLTPDDFAAKMTKRKLFETFPHIAEDVLVELWQAHGNNYKETVESIMVSSGKEGESLEPPISEEVVVEMREAYNQQNVCSSEGNETRTAVSYREEAARHLENRTQFYQKAMQAYQKGMTEVAIYYSGLAQKETDLYDHANGLAASMFLNEHSQKHQNYETLDLHFLYVKEAIAALDMFLDNSVHLLKGTNKTQYLFIITGRGKRSANGVSKIKPAVKARLKKRSINYIEVNPGLLKIKVSEHTIITTDLPEASRALQNQVCQ